MGSIVLIGMPGVGKSTIGVVLAKILGYRFVDADILIQEQEGRLLKEILEEDGVDGFIEAENRVNSTIMEERAVIATGGSVVYGKEAMENLKRVGTVVYLKLDYHCLERRLGDLKGRGVVLREGQDLRALYRERSPLYEKYADITVDESGLNVEPTLEAVIEKLERHGIGKPQKNVVAAGIQPIAKRFYWLDV